jgi:hypothetical protein
MRTLLAVCGQTLAAFVVALHPNLAAADPIPIVLTFDELATGEHGHTTYSDRGLQLCSFGLGTACSFLVQQDASAVSPPNVVRPGFGSTELPNFIGAFFVPDFPSAAWTVDFLALSITGTGPGQSAEWEVSIHDRLGNVLDTVRGSSNQTVAFPRASADIRSFRVLRTDSREAIDNVTFNPVVTPEPGSILLFGTGAAVLAARRWRARHRRAQ